MLRLRAQVMAIQGRAQDLIASGQADGLIAQKQVERDAAWFVEVS